ncbi:MAG: type II toxin-antitoxin system prevent-host-death family antitoxin [Mycobacteriaceae bacterium]
MTRSIPHRELRNNSSAVLRDVQAGETIEVTNHGVVVAVLVPPARARLASTRVVEAQRVGGFAQLPRIAAQEGSQAALDHLRGDR